MHGTEVLLIETGGTIAMEHDVNSQLVQPVDEPLSSKLSLSSITSTPGIELKVKQMYHHPSPHMTPDHMLGLHKKIKQELQSPSLAGIVITHGTDTLEETAFLLDLLHDDPRPIVVTGAMRPSNALGADGPVNLARSISVAASTEARNRGVLVVFQDEIHAARRVMKAHTSHLYAFRSSPPGPVGVITDKMPRFYDTPTPRGRFFQVDRLSKKIALFTAVAGMEAEWLTHIVDQGVDGIVFEAFGQGNLPITIVPQITKMLNDGLPVVLTSRCPEGDVDAAYNYEGGAKQLTDLGAILARRLNGPKARLKLMVLLEQITDLKELELYF